MYDGSRGELWIRATSDYSFIQDEEEAEVMALIVADLARRCSEEDPLQLVEHLEDTLSNALLISDRIPLTTPFTPALLEELFHLVVPAE